MAIIIGKTKGWVWWLAGLVCAVLFGSRAEAGQAVALYGVRIRPPRPKIDEKSVTEEQKKKAGELVDAWMAGVKPAEPGAGEAKQIAKLIESLGSSDFRTREAASREVVKFGAKALGQLTEAQKSKDAEVRIRASAAVATINSGTGRKEIPELRKIKAAAHVVIRARQAKLGKQAYKLSLEARKLQSEGKKVEAAKKRAEAGALYTTNGKLSRLYSLVVYGATGIRPGVGTAKYGVRRLPPIQLKGAPGGGAKVEARVEAKAAPLK